MKCYLHGPGRDQQIETFNKFNGNLSEFVNGSDIAESIQK